MKIHEAVNQHIPIREVLEKLSDYRLCWSSIIYKGNTNDGYKVNHRGNYLNNFTPGKEDRPVGGPRNIVKANLQEGVSYKEVVNWFECNFHLEEMLWQSYQQRKRGKKAKNNFESTLTLYKDNPQVIYTSERL